MGLNLPSDRRQALEWLEARIAQWNVAPAAIGLTSGQVIDIAQKVVNTRGSFTSVQTIRTDAKNETQTFYANADDMHASAAPLVANIKNFAENSADPQVVYDASGVLPADPPSPQSPPTVPTNIRRTVNPSGSITLFWDATGPTGSVYNVKRKLATEAIYTLIGQGDGVDKSFTDITLPVGTTSVTYIIQGVRGPLVGPESQAVTITFGVGADAGALGLAA